MKPQKQPSEAEVWSDVLSAHGMRRERVIAAAIKDFHGRLRRNQKRAVYITLAWLLGMVATLNPISSNALYQRKPWALIFLVVFLILHLLWMIQMFLLGKAWIRHNNLKEFSENNNH